MPSCMSLKFRQSSLGFVRPCTQEHVAAESFPVRHFLKSLAKVSRVSLQVETLVASIAMARFPSSQLAPALTEQFASFSRTAFASARLELSPSQPVPFPVASFIASSASLKVEAELFFLSFISLPQLSTLLASLNSTWALLNFFVLATRSVKHWSCLPFVAEVLRSPLFSPFLRFFGEFFFCPFLSS